MATFRIHTKWALVITTPSTDTTFEIDSDLPNQDTWELLQEFSTLEPTDFQRDLASSTLELQRKNWSIWAK